jgi:squalene-hopene/tetraprenyl-beta-curcumene cyclase
LPFELSVLPHQIFKWLRLPVVSYAIPALIAIGLVRHQLGTARWSLGMELRNLITPRALKVLTGIQPESGGFLEATPLTSFVVLSLAAAGQANHPVTVQGTQFLVSSRREDGSWPIDTHLATWVTTLAVQALSLKVDSGLNIRDHDLLPPEPKGKIRQWLLAQQHRAEHRFTHAAPGGWAWTPRSGGVPDADDTAGVLLALRRLGTIDPQTRQAATAGITWLLDLQNIDGGMPTFCRGWGKLPFDRSCPDITAHALRALVEWRPDVDGWLPGGVDSAVQHGVAYLRQTQRSDGSWCPLWFGNQHAPQRENLTYGTAQVVAGLRALAARGVGDLTPLIQTGCRWLLETQHASGGWGGAGGITPTIEETALALGALAGCTPASEPALQKAVTWLKETTQDGTVFPPSSIGLYFASLWYHEKLYPMIFMAAALRQLECP